MFLTSELTIELTAPAAANLRLLDVAGRVV